MPVYINAPALSAPAAGLPTVRNYSTLIGTDARVKAWFCATDAYLPSPMTLSGGRIFSAADRSTNGKVFAPNPTSRAPLLQANAYNGERGTAYFQRTRKDHLDLAAAVSVAGSFGMACVLKAPTATDSNSRFVAFLGDLSTQWARLGLGVNGSPIFWSVGQSGTSATVNATGYVADAWTIAIMGWDFPTKTAYLSLDGGLTWGSALNASAPQPASGTLRIGCDNLESFCAEAYVNDLILMEANPQAAANADLLANIRSYYSDAYYLPA